jgi:hypothetical protein
MGIIGSWKKNKEVKTVASKCGRVSFVNIKRKFRGVIVFLNCLPNCCWKLPADFFVYIQYVFNAFIFKTLS